jgi:hypothetical protein
MGWALHRAVEPHTFVLRAATVVAGGLVAVLILAAAHAAVTGVPPRRLLRSYGSDAGRFRR